MRPHRALYRAMSALTASQAARACTAVMSFGSPGIGEGGSCFQLRSTAWICGFSLWGTGVGSDGAIGGSWKPTVLRGAVAVAILAATSCSTPMSCVARWRISPANACAWAWRAACSAKVRLVRVSVTERSSSTLKPALWAS
ncbi:Uncharacterised protein [Mycobacterium tuberculosis]|uniref:Secreted protein n=1 Tax=Mycobacterium tuberculosis TaxID=1773 RepID=A0A916LEG6_MYCTX|nr:Uncharacterised protein [Mycobacterium tuberculosis]